MSQLTKDEEVRITALNVSLQSCVHNGSADILLRHASEIESFIDGSQKIAPVENIHGSHPAKR